MSKSSAKLGLSVLALILLAVTTFSLLRGSSIWYHPLILATALIAVAGWLDGEVK